MNPKIIDALPDYCKGILGNICKLAELDPDDLAIRDIIFRINSCKTTQELEYLLLNKDIVNLICHLVEVDSI